MSLQFTVQQAELAPALASIIGAIETRNTIPILSRVLLSSVGGSDLRLQATDLTMSMERTCPAQVIEEGSVAIPGKALLEYVRRLSGTIHVTVGDNFWASLKCGTSRSRIASNSPGDFPELPVPPSDRIAVMPADTLARLIDQTAYVVEDTHTRLSIPGLMLRITGGELHVLGRHDHRVAFAKIPLEGREGCWFVPIRSVQELRKMAEASDVDVEMLADGNNAFFRAGDRMLTARLVDAKMPDYSKILEAPFPHGATVATNPTLEAIERVAPFGEGTILKGSSVSLSWEGNSAKISASNQELGDGEECVQAQLAGPAWSGKFNTPYLRDTFVKCQSDNIVLHWSEDPRFSGNLRIEPEGGGFVYFCAGITK